MTFSELGLNSDLLKLLPNLAFKAPLPIQQQTIPAARLASATYRSGSRRKPVPEKPPLLAFRCRLAVLIATSVMCKLPILAPTRELCVQITNDIKKYGKYLNNFAATAIYGGSTHWRQIKDIKRGVRVVVLYSGRLIDMIDRGAVNLSAKIVVFDEADEMLNMGLKMTWHHIERNTSW